MPILAQDLFTDTGGTLLQNHTPDVGPGWVKQGASDVDITANGLAARAVAGTGWVYDIAVSPDNYDITCDINTALITNLSNQQYGIIGRRKTNGGFNDYYYAAMRKPPVGPLILTLNRWVSAIDTQLGSSTSVSAGVGQIRLVINGKKLTVYWQGIKKIGAITDGSILTGEPGIFSSFAHPSSSSEAWDDFVVQGDGIPIPPPIPNVRLKKFFFIKRLAQKRRGESFWYGSKPTLPQGPPIQGGLQVFVEDSIIVSDDQNVSS